MRLEKVETDAMHKEIVINSSPNEVRVALLEDHEVVEFMMERADHKRAVGNVFKGVVTAVRPGLQAAFVDIGMEKGGFLHVSDLVHDDPGDDDDRGRGRGRGRGRRREGLRPIETMLKEGDEILVQVTKEVIGTKGPRLTADISLPGRFMVLMPKGDHVGVSRKIEDRKERTRLKSILSELKPDDEAGAFIIRTAAIGQDPKMLERDMEYLRDLWKEIQTRAHGTKAPAVVHEDVGLIVSLIRDIFKDDIDSVVVDSKDDHQKLIQYVKTFSPELRDRIKLYSGDMPIFDKYGIESELKKSLDKKVWMKRGGFLVIEQTEALVAIDVNTGRFIGKKNQAETIFKTNMVAAKEIARQLRLRDVGGIIVLDFIDMDSEEDKKRVLAELRTHLKRDRSRTKTFAVSELGLIEMSRQRVQESLKDRLSDNCPYCNGSGQILSVDTLANKVERLLAKLAATRNEKAVQVRANPTLALELMTERANTVQQIERNTGIKIDVVDDARLHREEFQIVSLTRRKDLVAEIEKADEGERPAADERRGRGDSDRDRTQRRPAAAAREEEAAESDEREPRRRRRRDEDEAPRERGRRRRPRGGETGEAPARREPERRDADRREPERRETDRREPERRQAAEAEAGSDGRRRRRRPDEGGPSRGRTARGAEDRDEAEAKVTVTGPAAPSPAAGEDEEGDRPKRRRRRGRRGGRGRRRGSRGDEVAAGTQEGAEDADETAAPADSQQEARPVRTEEPGSVDVDEAVTESGPDRDEDDEVRTERPRRRRRPGEGGDEPRRPRDEGEDGGRRRSRRSRSRDERDDEERAAERQDMTGEIDTTESYVRPVPETETSLREPEESKAEPAGAETESDDTVDTERRESAPAASDDSPESDAPDEDDDPRSERRRRRRRTRASGTPTRLIGTGKTLDKKKS